MVTAGGGSAYVFSRGREDRWEIEHKMYSTASQYDAFGCSVSLWRDIAVIGADMGDGVVDDTGTAYIFTPSNVFSDADTTFEVSDSGGYISSGSMLAGGTWKVLLGAVICVGLAVFVIAVAFFRRVGADRHGMAELPMESVRGEYDDQNTTGLDVSSSHSWGGSSNGKDKKKKKKKKEPLKEQFEMADV